MLVEVPCGYQAADVDSSRLGRSGSEDIANVWMSGSNGNVGSLVAVHLMVAFVSVLIGTSCMVMVGGFFWESSPFPIGAGASPSLYQLAERE